MKTYLKFLTMLLVISFGATNALSETRSEVRKRLSNEFGDATYLIKIANIAKVGVYLNSKGRSWVLPVHLNAPAKRIPKKTYHWSVKPISGDRYGVCYQGRSCIEYTQFRKLRVGKGDIFGLQKFNASNSRKKILK